MDRKEHGMDREGLSTMPFSVALWLLFSSSHSFDLEDREAIEEGRMAGLRCNEERK